MTIDFGSKFTESKVLILTPTKKPFKIERFYMISNINYFILKTLSTT